MIKHNEALRIKKTYELILNRLQEERTGYETQLSAVEQSLKEKEFDVEALIKISKEAQGEVKDLKRGNAKNKEGLFVSEDLEHDLGSQ